MIEIIVAFGKLLLEELTPKIEQWNVHSCVGEIFIKIADYMKVYSHYIADYGLFLNSLIKSVKDPVFGPLLKVSTSKSKPFHPTNFNQFFFFFCFYEMRSMSK